MLVYLCRHAKAAPGEPDETRELTAAGHAQARKLAVRLAGLATPPRAVLSSPLLRARETAETVASVLGLENVPRAELAPGANVASLRNAVAGLDGPVATIGHQPDCSEIALALTGRDPGFAVGTSHAIELEP